MNIFNDVTLALNEFSIDAAEKSLRSAERNIANAHTPGYKRESIESKVCLGGSVLDLENFDEIFNGVQGGELRHMIGRTKVEKTKEQKDGNNVDEAKESFNAKKALLESRVAAMLANARFGTLDSAIGK